MSGTCYSVNYSVNYVIATYEGLHDSRLSDITTSHLVLQTQLEVLINNLQNSNSHIKYITILCPPCKNIHEKINGYYGEKSEWIRKFSELNIILHYIVYKGTNLNHSYDQWIQGMCYRKDVDYHIIIEDDYMIDPQCVNFTDKLVSIYKQKFPDNIGYLCTLEGPHNNNYRFPNHAAISNGLISQCTISKLGDNILEDFYNTSDTYSQLKFSSLFSEKQIPIRDYSYTCRVEFWDTGIQSIIDYSEEDSLSQEHIFIPIQSYLSRSKGDIKKIKRKWNRDFHYP